jgi:hypothetical protein
MNHLQIKSALYPTPNFSQIDKIWEVWLEIGLRSNIKYGFTAPICRELTIIQ